MAYEERRRREGVGESSGDDGWETVEERGGVLGLCSVFWELWRKALRRLLSEGSEPDLAAVGGAITPSAMSGVLDVPADRAAASERAPEEFLDRMLLLTFRSVGRGRSTGSLGSDSSASPSFSLSGECSAVSGALPLSSDECSAMGIPKLEFGTSTSSLHC